MYTLLRKSKFRPGKYRHIFVAALFLSFHYYLVTYINSTFLKGIVSENIIGLLYAIGSTITIAVFLTIAPAIKKWGLYRFVFTLSLVEIAALLTLALSHSPLLILLAFIVHDANNPVLLASLDVYLEDNSDISQIGRLRGTFLTILSVAAVISPLAIGSLVDDGTFTPIYMFSAFFAFLFLLSVILNFKRHADGEFREIKVFKELREFWKDKNIRHIGMCSAILQFFYSWLVIYVPIYLAFNMGFSWANTALIISISLIPFLLFEIPVGQSADGNGSEKHLISLGFFLMTVALILFSFIPAGSFYAWAAILFLARSGASIVEPASDSYFFKKSKGRDELIGIYRIASPGAFVVGSVFGSILLTFIPLGNIFPILASVTFSGFLISKLLKNNTVSL